MNGWNLVYLRENRVRINGFFSVWKEVSSGVLEGQFLAHSCSLFTLMTWRWEQNVTFPNVLMRLKEAKGHVLIKMWTN